MGAVLADVLDGALVVYDPDLRELTVVGDRMGDQPDLEAAIAEARGSGRCVELSGSAAFDASIGHAYVVTALAGTEHLGTLVLHHRTTPLGLADRRTIERGALVTALVLLFGRSVAEAEDRVRGELLADLLSGREQDPTRLRERARRQGSDLDRPGVVAVASVDTLDRHRAAQVAARLAGDLHGLGGGHEGYVVLVAPLDSARDARAAGRQLQERVLAAGGTATVGVAEAGPGIPAVAAAYLEARRCVSTLLTLGRSGEVSDPVGLGLAQLVLGRGGSAELDAFVTAMIGPVLEYDERRGTDLVTTLDAWFASGSRPAETARTMHVHPNTVAQRLDRIGKLLDSGWRDPARALDLQMALRLWRLRR